MIHSTPSLDQFTLLEMREIRPEHGGGAALEGETIGRTAGSSPAELAGPEFSKSVCADSFTPIPVWTTSHRGKCMKFGLSTGDAPPRKVRLSAEMRDQIRLSYPAPKSQSRYEQSHSLPSLFGPLPTMENGEKSGRTRGTLCPER
ncbi:hypothetical protein chiPu_0012380 [Chiloscyllium punctatum]|uniref:Uncharacterized protein n=1 Tax=Chiloscyllium punctatum TaxID=137246 RepID=A0A401SU36_CHIPU|nr:hypothetical protein [Chiloscyllium punctatum]